MNQKNNPALNLAPFGHWTMCDTTAQRKQVVAFTGYWREES